LKGERSFWFSNLTTFINIFGGANVEKQKLIALWGNEICLQNCNMQIPNDSSLVGGHSGGHGHFCKIG
jgi:hypothetical protein